MWSHPLAKFIRKDEMPPGISAADDSDQASFMNIMYKQTTWAFPVRRFLDGSNLGAHEQHCQADAVLRSVWGLKFTCWMRILHKANEMMLLLKF